MTKLRSTPIVQADIEEYLKDYSDFSFEIQVLKKLTDLGLPCTHNGIYTDPVTGKSREFDIRALRKYGIVRISMSIECKNIRNNFPLVLHCIRRRESKSHIELIHTFKAGKTSVPQSSENIRLPYTLYPKDQYVAKSVDQVGRREHDKGIIATDGGVFDKINQANNSAKDLIEEAYYLEESKKDYYTFICPVLVIPDLALWQVKYSDDGSYDGLPEQVDHISYYIDKEWTVGNEPESLTYTMSHLEIVTVSWLRTFVEEYFRDLVNYCNKAYSKKE